MKAIVLETFGGTGQLKLIEKALPVVGDHDVLIQVKAISINPVDVKTRSGKGMADRLKNQLPMVLGWDISGIVTTTGKAVTRFKTGDAVLGMVNFPGLGNAYAAYVAAPEDQLALKPASIPHTQAAAATLAALTAWQADGSTIAGSAGPQSADPRGGRRRRAFCGTDC